MTIQKFSSSLARAKVMMTLTDERNGLSYRETHQTQMWSKRGYFNRKMYRQQA